MLTRSFVACAVALLIVAVAGSAGQQKTDPALDKLAAAFAEAFNAKDAARVASFYADDAIVMPPDQAMVRGRRNVEAYYARGFRQDISNFRLLPIESAITGAHGFEAGTSTLTERKASSTRGPDVITTDGKYVVIYKRVNGQWKIAYDIFNND
jgi:ketosteroid isomerase-like protein